MTQLLAVEAPRRCWAVRTHMISCKTVETLTNQIRRDRAGDWRGYGSAPPSASALDLPKPLLVWGHCQPRQVGDDDRREPRLLTHHWLSTACVSQEAVSMPGPATPTPALASCRSGVLLPTRRQGGVRLAKGKVRVGEVQTFRRPWRRGLEGGRRRVQAAGLQDERRVRRRRQRRQERGFLLLLNSVPGAPG